MKLYNFDNADRGECYSVVSSSLDSAIKAVIKRVRLINPLYTIEYNQPTKDKFRIGMQCIDDPTIKHVYTYEINVFKAGQVLTTQWN